MKCRVCGDENPSEGFKDRGADRGFEHICRPCDRKRLAEYHSKHRERINRRKSLRVRPMTEKRRASKLVRDAVGQGKIEKPQQCQDCLVVFDRARIEGHHEDYRKPYDVIWLCRSCHGKRHRKCVTVGVPPGRDTPNE